MSSRTLFTSLSVAVAVGALLFALFGSFDGDEQSLSESASDTTQQRNDENSSSAGEHRNASEPALIVAEPAETPEGMVWIPGETFVMGNKRGAPDKNPMHLKDIPEHYDAMLEHGRKPVFLIVWTSDRIGQKSLDSNLGVCAQHPRVRLGLYTQVQSQPVAPS
ncbi:MAG: hypothetical protein IID46_02320, partial [Planctomycetes bacterium]|nr:hypothetical protein [Planctomycetota bacterium]